MTLRWSAIALAILFVALHALALPAEGFFSGDQGAKYLQARAFADHPRNPGVDVRAVDIDPAFQYQEPILRNQRGLLVAEFSWLLPLLTAPFLALFGLQGLYVVPALSAIVILCAVASFARSAADPTGVRAAWIVAAASPVIVYGSELWEHAPAAACVALAASLVFEERGATGEERRFAARWFGAGALVAIGALFREESALALPAFWIMSGIGRGSSRVGPGAVGLGQGRPHVGPGAVGLGQGRPRVGHRAAGLDPRASMLAWSLGGAAAVLIAAAPMNMLVYGAPLPLHLTAEAAKVQSFWAERLSIAADMLLPQYGRVVFVVAAAGGIAAAVRGRVSIVHAAVVTLLVISVGIPLVRELRGVPPYYAYNMRSAAHTWPFASALLYWALRLRRPDSAAASAGQASTRFMVTAALLMIAGAVLIVPSSGGAQWSPRYLFFAAPLLAAAAAKTALQAERPAVKWMTAIVLGASIVMQAGGFMYLRDAKLRNARLIDTVSILTAPGDVMLTDIVWFPEVASPLLASRRVLFTWDRAQLVPMASRVTQLGFRRFGIVTLPTSYDAPAEIRTASAICRSRPGSALAIDQRGLLLTRYSCENR